MRRPWPCAGAVGRAHHAAGAPCQIGERARGFLYTVSVVGTTGERAALSDRFAEVVEPREGKHAAPVALGFGISTPEHALQAAQAGADGVIVGTRLVRAAGESEDPAGAVGEVVGELAAALAARVELHLAASPGRGGRPWAPDAASSRAGCYRIRAQWDWYSP